MTVSTIYPSSDGYIESQNNTYSTMLAGSTFTVNTAGASIRAGQTFLTPTYYGFQCFMAFDTSVVGSNDISAVELSLYGDSDDSTTNFTMAIGAYDWSSGGLTSADWRTTAQLAAITDLATFSSSIFGFSYNIFTNASGGTPFIAAINKTGTTYLMGYSVGLKAGTPAPTNNEYMLFVSTEQGGVQRPRLIITHAPAVGGSVSGVDPMGRMGYFGL